MKFSNLQLFRSSVSQILGLMASSIGSFLLWLLAAHRYSPQDVGVAAGIVAFVTLLSTILSAGLGQFLLVAQTQGQWIISSRLIGLIVVGEPCLAALICASIFRGTRGIVGIDALAAVAIFAFGLSLTSLQDSIYVSAGQLVDIPLKAVAISLGRLLLVLYPLHSIDSQSMLLIVLVLPQVLAGIVWGLCRLPKAIKRQERKQNNQSTKPILQLLGVGYLYALSVTANGYILPAIATNALKASDAAVFYVTWMVASLPSVVSGSVANALVARLGAKRDVLVQLRRILTSYCVVAAGMTILLALMGPLILHLYGAHYQQGKVALWVLLFGQAFSGIGMVLLAFARLLGDTRSTTVTIGAWLLCVVGVGVLGIPTGTVVGIALLYMVGNIAAAMAVGTLVFRHIISNRAPSEGKQTATLGSASQ